MSAPPPAAMPAPTPAGSPAEPSAAPSDAPPVGPPAPDLAEPPSQRLLIEADLRRRVRRLAWGMGLPLLLLLLAMAWVHYRQQLACGLVPDHAQAPLWLQMLPVGLLALGLLLVIALAQWLVQREFVRPALVVMAYGRALTQDPQLPPPVLPPRWQPWIAGITQLVTSRSEMARRQHRSEAFKSAVVDTALSAIVITDAQGCVVDWNPAAEAMFGRPRSQTLGQPVGQLIIPPRLRAGHDAGMQRLQQGGAPRVSGQRLEMPALRADGREFPIEMVLSRIVVAGETHYCAFISDLSAQQQARQEIERQRDALRQSEKLGAMGSLLAGVAHELNNPLAIVMGRASLLEDKLSDPALQHDAQRIREAANRCGRIVRTFLNMARARPPQRQAVVLNDLVRAAAELLGYTLRSHGIRLVLELAPDLPTLHADADQLGQVVLNLLVNAQHALGSQPLAEGGRERQIGISTGLEPRRPQREPRVWLRVADNGPGVPPDLQARLFEPFFTTKAEGAGTGLGLSVSRAMVREHGGDLALETGYPGPGACFRMSLPTHGQVEAAESGTAAASPAPPPELGQRVLVVDDEAELAELMRDTLEAAGYEVVCAECAEVALEMLAEMRFDAIVSDLQMPDGDGAALWRGVGQHQGALQQRVLFVTGDTLSPSAAAFLQGTGRPALEKPFQPHELLRQVHALLYEPSQNI